MKSKKMQNRPFIGIHFECCSVYTRIYKNAKGDSYAGHCPRCRRPLRLKVGEGGSNQRFFRAR